MPYYEMVFAIEAADEDEADQLHEKMVAAIGCSDDPEHECPHFRCSTWRPVTDEDLAG